MDEIQTVIRDITARMEAIGQSANPESIRALIQTQIEESLRAHGAQGFTFAGAGAQGDLKGSKWGRLGLKEEDVLFLHDWLLAGQLAGRGKGPSEQLRNFYGAHVRAMDTAETGYGLHLVSAAYSSTLWDAAMPQSRIMALLPRFPMASPTEYLPVAAGLPEVLLFSESTAYNSSNLTTSKTGSNRVTVTAKKLGFHEMWSGEMEEDSIIPFVPFLRARAEAAVAYYNDSLVLNGDDTDAGTGNINLDDANPADTKHYLAFDGIRHVGLVDNTANRADAAAAPTLAMLSLQRGRMLDRTYNIDWGHPQNPDDLIYVADPQTADAIAAIDDVINWKVYASRPLLNGEQAQILGHPVISSIAMSLTMADGKVDATSNTKGHRCAFNRNAFVVGWLRQIKMEFERLPRSDQSAMVYTWRLGLGRYSPTGAASGIEAADVLYDITV